MDTLDFVESILLLIGFLLKVGELEMQFLDGFRGNC